MTKTSTFIESLHLRLLRFKFGRITSRAVWRIRGSKHHIFQLGTDRSTEASCPTTIRVDSETAISDYPEIAAKLSPKLSQTLPIELSNGATAIIGLCEKGEPSSIALFKSGLNINRWYIPIPDHATVSYGWYTAPSHRGKGIIAALIQEGIRELDLDRQHIYADCRTDNTPSIRAMRKIGFTKIATVPRMKRNA